MSHLCEMPQTRNSSSEIQRILSDSKTIAIVGLSNNPYKDSYMVAQFMQNRGYRIIPVNPKLCESEPSVLFNEPCYKSLLDIPFHIDIVNVFRKPEAIPEIALHAIQIKANVLWLQSGIVHNESAKMALSAGLQVVQSRCIKVEASYL